MGKLFKFALAIFLIGVGCFALFSIISEDSVFNEADEENYTYHELIYTADNFVGFDFDFENRDFIVRTSDNDQIKVTYYTTERDPVTVDENTNILKLENDIDWIDSLFSGFTYLFSAEEYMDVYLYLPVSQEYDIDCNTSNGEFDINSIGNINVLDFTTSNGDIQLIDVSADEIDLSTSNGDVDLEQVVSLTDINIYTSNGEISLVDTSASDLIKFKSSNGELNLSNVTADTIDGYTSNDDISATNITADMLSLDTSNGRVTVTIYGDESDYEVRMSTSNGDLTYNGIKVDQESFNVGAQYSIDLDSSNGDITITFID